MELQPTCQNSQFTGDLHPGTCGKNEKMSHRPATFISASAIGFYGEGGSNRLTEKSKGKDCFISRVCRQWEAASLGAVKAGIRTVQLRIGVVLTPAGGALERMLRPFFDGAWHPVG